MMHEEHGATIVLSVNGMRRVIADVWADRTLLSVLRDDLALTGAKEGCGIGACGACTVILDGEMVSSCIQLAVLADAGNVRTVEGLAQGDELDPVQRAFIKHNGLQCGACTPGQIMAARALLDQSPSPSHAEIIEWMTGNLCRCTGYAQILRAVFSAGASRTGAL